MPNVILQDGIHFEEVNAYEVKTTFLNNQETVSGIFSFNEEYEMISFTTNDRAVSENDGTINYIPWSAICDAYEYNDAGIKLPTNFKAVWHYDDEDFLYFDGAISDFRYQN